MIEIIIGATVVLILLIIFLRSNKSSPKPTEKSVISKKNEEPEVKVINLK